MDALDGLLDAPRARAAFLLRSRMAPPWSLEIRDEAPLTVVAVVAGECWLTATGLQRRLEPGDVAVLRGPDPYVVSDRAGRRPQAAILPGQVCRAPDGVSPQHVMGPVGPRSWGNSATGPTVLLTGTYATAPAVSDSLLRGLPPAFAFGRDEWPGPVLAMLIDEIDRDRPGQEAVLDRLLDVLTVSVLRAWFTDRPAPAWFGAYRDPIVGPALRLLQAAPGRSWSVQLLADEVGVARATLARRFRAVAGVAPMTFLADWRLSLAADRLRESDDTLDAVARRVGYGTGFALSDAFKRRFGISPSQYRAAHGSG